MMDGQTVKDYLTNDKFASKIFRGVLPINFLPHHTVERPSSFIVNTLPINEFDEYPQGEHWIALFIPKKGPIEYFDSYGLKPLNKEIYDFIQINGKKFIRNKFKIQGFNSINCGKYSIFYLFLRSRNIPMYRIVKFFIKYRKYNDRIIDRIFNKIK